VTIARSFRISWPASTHWPWPTATSRTSPVRVAGIGTAASASTVPLSTTSLRIVPIVTGTCGSMISADGTSGPSAVTWSGMNASFTSAAAIAAKIRIHRIGKTHLRATLTRRTLRTDEPQPYAGAKTSESA
jgi:hypothetical protein